MEITGVKENIGRDGPQESISRPAPKPEQAKEREKAPSPDFLKISTSGSGNEENIKALTESINKMMQAMRFSLQFVVDRQSGKVVVKVLDDKGNLIRRIPPDGMSGLSERIGGNAGIVLNKLLE